MYTKVMIEMFLMEHLGDHNKALFVVGGEKTFYHSLLLASLLMHEQGAMQSQEFLTSSLMRLAARSCIPTHPTLLLIECVPEKIAQAKTLQQGAACGHKGHSAQLPRSFLRTCQCWQHSFLSMKAGVLIYLCTALAVKMHYNIYFSCKTTERLAYYISVQFEIACKRCLR